MHRACLIALLPIVACSGQPPEAGCEPGGDATLSVGLGLDGYAPIANGEEVPFVYGAQGGYHVELGLEATHLDAEDFVTGSFEGRIDGEVVATAKPWLSFRCDPETETQQSWGTLLIFDAQPPELHRVDAEIDAEVTDASGVVVRAEITIHLIDPMAE